METKNSMPKVGILISARNAEKFIVETLQSCLDQTYENLVVYVLDDASTDNTRACIWSVMSDLKNVNRLAVMQTDENLGYARAYNSLSYMASTQECDYIFIMGHDDVLSEDCIEKMVEMAISEDADWVNVNAVMFREVNGDKQAIQIMFNTTAASYEDTLNLHSGCCAFALFKMDIWNYYGGYDIGITPRHMKIGLEDCELWMRLKKDNRKQAIVPYQLYYYRSHANNNHMVVHPYKNYLLGIIHAKHGKSKN